MYYRKSIQVAASRITALLASFLLVSLASQSALSAPVLSVYNELYFDTESQDILGNVINFDSNLITSNQDVLGPMEVFNWTNSISNDLQDEYGESLIAEAYTAFSLDSSASNAYELTIEFFYNAPSPANQNPTTIYVESEYDGLITDLTQSSPFSELYIFDILPGELIEYLWFYEIAGVDQFSLSAASSLNVVAMNEILPTQVSEPSSLAILLLGGLGLLFVRRKV